ncbi:MAG: hypothetical protein KKH99_14685 [Proteobacteria bacterium]|nr:hypothetical protein [Pseudomonadota bacterium]
MDFKELKTLGLSNGEVKVYSAILNTGTASINNIHEKTGLERRAIYDIINKLIEKGLISYTIERGKRTYQCAPPNKLRVEAEKKIEELKSFEKIIPDIEEIYEKSKPKIRFEVYRGKEGMKTIFEDILNHKNLYAIGGGMYLVKELPYNWPHYNKRRIKSSCAWNNLIRWELRNKMPKTKLLNVKVLPKEFSGNPNVIVIYGNKVVNLSWGEEIFAFMMESKEIAENYKKYHKYLWDKVAKPI